VYKKGPLRFRGPFLLLLFGSSRIKDSLFLPVEEIIEAVAKRSGELHDQGILGNKKAPLGGPKALK
jgi:hypothetical protein